MILSDVDIRKAVAAGRIGIEPFDEDDVQPSSIDLRVDRFFRTFHNARYPYIDVKKPMSELTELVEVAEDEAFILHPGEFVLGSTREYVKLPHDLVARLEGKSSLGRLGLLIHSSIPGDEIVPYLRNGTIELLRIGEIVSKRYEGSVIAFDPETFEVGFHEVTGFFEGAPDRIFELILASGRKVSLTGGHDLFTLDGRGELTRCRIAELHEGTKVAIAGRIPDPKDGVVTISLLDLAPESAYRTLVCGGPTVVRAWEERPGQLAEILRERGIKHHSSYYRRKALLPLDAALEAGLEAQLHAGDFISVRGGRNRLPLVIPIDSELAWLLGLYVADGSRRTGQVHIANTDQAILDRAAKVLSSLGLPVHRRPGYIVSCSSVLSHLIEWLQFGERAQAKRIPKYVLGWPDFLLRSFLEGFVDGDGSREATRVSLWTSSKGLVGDMLLLCSRLGMQASASSRRGRVTVAGLDSAPRAQAAYRDASLLGPLDRAT